MERDPDPWNWTTDDVVEEFCYSRSIWANDRPNVKLPDPSKLEQALRDNEVDGATILEVGHEQLKDEFEIKPFGHRDGLLWGIEQLQQQSMKWRERSHSKAMMQPHVLASTNQTPTTSFRTPGMSWPARSPSLPTIHDHLIVSDRAIEGHSDPAALALTTNKEVVSKQLSNSEPGATEQCRPGETLVEDESGRKKRRLTLGQPSALTTRRRLSASIQRPSSQKYLELPSRTILSGIRTPSRTYLGPNKLTLDSIFFGLGQFGKPINADWDVGPVSGNGTAVPDFELILLPDRPIPGRQKYVHSRLVKFFKELPYEIDINGCSAQLLHPYPSAPDVGESSRSVILLQSTENDIIATRERASRFDAKEFESYDNGSNPSNREWDFLDHWRHEETEEIPLYGESVENSDWDRCVESIEAEEEAEKEQEQIESRTLDTETVLTIIDEEIERFVQQWITQKLPLRENKAWSIWRKPKGSRARFNEAARAREQVEVLGKRLTKLKASILGEVWYKEKKVRKLCRSLQETVNEREEEKFKASIWLRTEAPLRPTAELRVKKKARIDYDSDPDAVDVSGSDVIDDPDSEADFIDIDNVQYLDMTMDGDSEAEQPDQLHSNHHSPSGIQSEVDSVIGAQSTVHACKTEHDSTDEHSLAKAKSGQNIVPSPKRPDVQSPPSNVIDLTMSDEEFQAFGDDPLHDSDEQVLVWTWNMLVERTDRIRLLIKMLRTLPRDYYSTLRNYISRDQGLILSNEIKDTANNIVRQIEQEDGACTDLVRLYSCWLDCSKELFDRMEISGVVAFSRPIPVSKAEQVVLACQERYEDVNSFCKLIQDIFAHHPHPIPTKSIELTIVEGDLGGESVPETSQDTPHKKRKRVVQESKVGIQKRSKALRTREEYETRSRVFLETQSSELVNVDGMVAVNVGKQDEEDPIYLNHHIAEHIQQHQIEGLQFMWREVVVNSLDGEDVQGCLLAHTMGLGKTMQV
jgi:hypothetical protein